MKFRDEAGFLLIRLGAVLGMLLIALFFFTGGSNDTDEVIAFIEPSSEPAETVVPEATLETWVEKVEIFALPTETTEPTEQTEPVQESTPPDVQEASVAMDNLKTIEHPTESATEPTQWEEPQVLERYQDVPLTQEEYWELAAIIWLEARNQSPEGQQAVAEVILNRVLHSGFPDTVYEVIHQGENTSGQQFEPVGQIYQASPGQDQMDAIEGALFWMAVSSLIPTLARRSYASQVCRGRSLSVAILLMPLRKKHRRRDRILFRASSLVQSLPTAIWQEQVSKIAAWSISVWISAA